MKSSVLLDREAGQEPNYGATKKHPDFVDDYCGDQSRHGSVSLGKTADVLPQKTAEEGNTKWGRQVTKFLWILPLVHSEFWIAAGFSLLQSFYPAMASDKGLDADEYSYVYSAYKIAMMFGAILAERIMVWSSPVACYLLGMTGCFIFNLLFGSLYWIPGGTVNLAVGLASAFLGGVANSLYIVSAYAVFTNRFVSNTGVAIASLEFTFTTGNMIGSILGGALIEKWGYPAPFFVIGIIIILAFPAIVSLKSVLNKDCGSFAQAHDPKEVTINYSKLLWDPMFIAGLGCMVLCWGQMGFNEPTLEPSLREFDLSSTEIGTVYTIQFGSSAIGSIIAAAFAHFKGEALFALLGLVLSFAAFLIVGPAPFIPADRTLTMVYISQIFMGVGISSLYICGFCHSLAVTLERGYPDTVRTTGFVSSVSHTCLFLGGLIMPPVAGYLVDAFNYGTATLIMAVLLAAWIPVMLAVWVSKAFCSFRTAKLSLTDPKKQCTIQNNNNYYVSKN
ncbi:MFS-type transporter SLC18B1-like [Dermacentor variabilis]|uniref:MFS-type transporter SLC18B1-like n=1 Tax=Dermacentor variabilis TaxID=34621 RepID=UPI003F5C0A61